MGNLRQSNKFLKEKGTLLVNLGCGSVQPEGWINIDYSNRAHLVKYLPWLDRVLTKMGLIPPTEFLGDTVVFDVRKPLPFDEGSVLGFYAGELWEHLLRIEGESLMRECLRALVTGGHLRINVPDNYRFWKRYCNAVEEILNKPRSLWSEERSAKFVEMFFENICVSKTILGSVGHFHKWAYDEVSLILCFEKAGFIGVRRCNLYDSEIPEIKSVERNAYLVVEGTKPL